MNSASASPNFRRLLVMRLARRACVLLGAAVTPIVCAQGNENSTLEWDLELLSMDLNATALMPLGPGWGPILTDVHVGESANLASLGRAFARKGSPEGAAADAPVPGDQYFV